MTLTHLERLEAESIHIMREVVAESREAGDAVLHWQGQLGHAAPGHEGVPSRPSRPFPFLHIDTPWKFREMIRVPRSTAKTAGPGPARTRQSRGPPAEHQSLCPRIGAPHRHHEDTGLEAGAGRIRIRRGLRGGAPRRREVARQGADLLLPLPAASLGSRGTSGRSCGACTTPANSRGELPGVPALELDRGRRLAVHRRREDPYSAALLREGSGRSSSATAR